MAEPPKDKESDEKEQEKEAAVVETKWRPAFEGVLHNILKEYEGHDDKVREGMSTGMRRLFENPYYEELRQFVREGGNADLGLEDGQRIMFYPRLSDMAFYVDVFGTDTSFEKDRRLRVMKFKMMSVFYTLHRLDGALAERFMHFGGLTSLVKLLAEDNNIIQSQAVELLMEMMSPQINMLTASSQRQEHLHHEMYLAIQAQAFWQNLSKIIAEPHEVFPRSHEHSLKLMAGAVGWLRGEDGGDTVPEQGPPPGMLKAADALQALLDGGPRLNPEVRGLAEDLMEELKEGPTVRSDPLKGTDLDAAKGLIFAEKAQAREDGGHSWQALKRLGTDAFKAGLLWPAEAAYQLSLSEGGKIPDSEATLIHSNRALVLLKAGHPAEAAEAAAKALEHDPSNSKAAFRRATALLEQSSGCKEVETHASAATEARDLAQAALEAAEKAVSLEPKDSKVADLAARSRQRLEAMQALAGSAAPAAEPDAALEGMD